MTVEGSAAGDAPTSEVGDYVVTPADFSAHRSTILSLCSRGLAEGGWKESKIAWYYERNPEGVPLTFLLRKGNRIVGVASIAQRTMQWGTRRVRAGFLLDFVVDAKHRGFFPALMLQKRLRFLTEATHPLAFGVPNPHSEAIVRRAGYRRVGLMSRTARVLRAGEYLSRYVPRPVGAVLGAIADRGRLTLDWLGGVGLPQYAWRWRYEPGPQFDALWERVATCGLLMGPRDNAFLRWRFVENPNGRYRFFLLTRPGSDDLVAYAVCIERDETLHVADFLVDSQAKGIAACRLHSSATARRCRPCGPWVRCAAKSGPSMRRSASWMPFPTRRIGTSPAPMGIRDQDRRRQGPAAPRAYGRKPRARYSEPL